MMSETAVLIEEDSESRTSEKENEKEFLCYVNQRLGGETEKKLIDQQTDTLNLLLKIDEIVEDQIEIEEEH